jgi:hypothetical protein
MAFVIILVVVVVAATVLYNMWLFDCLIRWEYEHHREEWERDGKPDGFFWRAKDCKFWSSDMAKKRITGAWLLKTPAWASKSPECRRWLAHVRVIALVASIVVLTILFRTFFR